MNIDSWKMWQAEFDYYVKTSDIITGTPIWDQLVEQYGWPYDGAA